MFTGIVQSVGAVRAITPRNGDVELLIGAPGLDLKSVAIGDSISVSGCCLTVTRLEADAFAADVSVETLNVTTLGQWRAGQRVNLEKALYAGQPLGGHYVTGHVDGVATLSSIRETENARVLRVTPPMGLMGLVAPKGSVALDGISLTVAEVAPESFTVWIIPHTWENTTMARRKTGDLLSIETDMLARYLARLLTARTEGITEASLKAAGFD